MSINLGQEEWGGGREVHLVLSELDMKASGTKW